MWYDQRARPPQSAGGIPIDAWRATFEALKQGRPAALVTVLRTKGSVPRGAGSRMAVEPDGGCHDTVGGGAGEHEGARAARRSIETDRSSILRLDMGGARTDPGAMVCGGSMELLIEPFRPDRDTEWVGTVIRIREEGDGALVVRAIDEAASRVSSVLAVLKEDGSPGWALPGVPLPDLPESKPDPPITIRESEGGPAYVFETIPPLERLVIVGGGHIGKALSEIGALLGFEVAVLDERPEFADPARFPQAARVLCGDPGELLSAMPAGEHAHFVLVSHGYPSDIRALAALAGRRARYIGMIGSRRRVEAVRRALLENGIDPAELDRVHAPIGLDIGSETPEEIAVAIAGEIIAVRSGRDRNVGPLSRREGTA